MTNKIAPKHASSLPLGMRSLLANSALRSDCGCYSLTPLYALTAVALRSDCSRFSSRNASQRNTNMVEAKFTTIHVAVTSSY